MNIILSELRVLSGEMKLRTNRRRQRGQRLRQAHGATEKLNTAGPVA